jgi:hypothetical protein
MTKWPLHPKPYNEYELLSRWIEKLAETYEVSYTSFCKNALKLTVEEIGSLRTSLPEKALLILSNGTGITIDDLEKRDLDNTFKKLKLEVDKKMAEDPDAFSCYLK